MTKTLNKKNCLPTTDYRTLFAEITKGPRVMPRRTMIYGVHGVGKSTFASHAPGAVFLPTEEGTNDFDCSRFPLLETFEEVIQAITELFRQDHGYKTVVIDSLDWLEKLVGDRVCKDHNVSSIEDFKT